MGNMGMAENEMHEKLDQLHRESGHADSCATRFPGGVCDCKRFGSQAGKLTGTAPMPDYSEPGLGGHKHTDNRGYVHWCYHKCRGILTSWQFWLGVTFSFPLEHLLWEKLWPFYLLTKWWGL